ncbi:putative cytoplasmic protein [Salmonella enterica]|nr:putative cytoplasmic protein [Salmonella enterica]
MHAFKLNQPVPELQPVGSVSLLGALPTEGDPQVAVAMIYGKPEDVFTCGLFHRPAAVSLWFIPLLNMQPCWKGKWNSLSRVRSRYVFHRATVGLLRRGLKWHGKF